MNVRMACAIGAMVGLAASFGCEKKSSAPAPAPTTGRTASTTPAATEPAATTLPAATAPSSTAMDAEHARTAAELIRDGIAFFLSKQNADGGWGFDMPPGQSHPGLTAMVLKCLLQHPDFDNDSPPVAKGFEFLMKSRQPDGGFYVPQEGNANYVTSLAVMALATAKDPKHKSELADAIKFLRGQQIRPGSTTPAGEAVAEDNPFVGGVSYGKHGRPDLSNLGFWMEAMHEAGVSGDDADMQRALAFVQRVQNRTEGTEGQSFVVRGEDDGGFIYAIDRKGSEFVGESMAGDGDRGLRSYGSMTYTGFKSLLYANVAKGDPRVRAAYEWIRRYWRLDSNPNMPQMQSQQGLYYYYHVFAKALRAWGQDVISDTRDVPHNWRQELIDVLAGSRKSADGRKCWSNDKEERWFEGNPILATAYAVLALQETVGK